MSEHIGILTFRFVNVLGVYFPNTRYGHLFMSLTREHMPFCVIYYSTVYNIFFSVYLKHHMEYLYGLTFTVYVDAGSVRIELYVPDYQIAYLQRSCTASIHKTKQSLVFYSDFIPFEGASPFARNFLLWTF